MVETSDGNLVRRNRRHLRVIPDGIPEENLIERRIDRETPKETVDDMKNRTSKRYIEEC